MSIYKAFDHLKWDTLHQNHHDRWDLLHSRYHLDPRQVQSCTSLDDLAQKCIHLCRQYLFTSVWQQQAFGEELQKGWRAMFETISDDFLEDYLTLSLCDHLIATFSHRFYCDNLEPYRSIDAKSQHELSGCLKKLFRYYSPDMANSKKERDSFVKSKKKNFISYQQDTESNVRRYFVLLAERAKSVSLQKDVENHIKDASPQECATIDSIFADLFAAPNWLFSIAMANNWKNSPFSTKSRENGVENGVFIFLRNWDEEKNQQNRCLLGDLTGFLADNELCQFLLKWEPESTAISWPSNVSFVPVDSSSLPVLQIRRTDVWNEKHLGFVAIPCNPTWLCSSKQAGDSCNHRKNLKYGRTLCQSTEDCKFKEHYVMPAQRYALRDGTTEVEIPAEMQYVFNSYLLEKNFHGYAIILAISRIYSHPKERLSSGQLNQYTNVLRVIRLHAPLVHPQLIMLLNDYISQVDCGLTAPSWGVADWTSWIEPYIDYWNEVALPVLEELFLWCIYEYYSLETIFQAIECSFLSDTPSGTSSEYLSTWSGKASTPIEESLQAAYLRCNRLNRYRMIPKQREPSIQSSLPKMDKAEDQKDTKADQPIQDSQPKGNPFDDATRRQLNRLIARGYSAAMGYVGGSEFRIGECTAFDSPDCSSSSVPD